MTTKTAVKKHARSSNFGVHGPSAGRNNPTMTLVRIHTVIAVVTMLLQPGTIIADDELVVWRTGEALERQLESRLHPQLPESTLRSALTRLSRSEEVAVWIDRRIDPDQKVVLTANDVTLKECFNILARQSRIDVCRVGPVFYFSSGPVCSRLPTLAALRRQGIRGLSSQHQRQLLPARSSSWEPLTAPRELVRELGDEFGLSMVGLDQIPHDLWPGGDLPPLGFSDRLTLLLAGFDLTFALDSEGSSLHLVRMPETVSLERGYPLGNHGPNVMAILREKFPRARIRADSRRIVVVGMWEDHQLIDRLLKGEAVRRRVHRPGQKVFTMKVQNETAGTVVAMLAERLQLEFKPGTGTVENLHQRVSFEVTNASQQELLRAVLGPVGLSWRIEGGELHVEETDDN